jgi:hypothetical protein
MCRHTGLVREWRFERESFDALQHCEECGAARLLRAGKWSRWRHLPIDAVPAGPGVVIRGVLRGLIG